MRSSVHYLEFTSPFTIYDLPFSLSEMIHPLNSSFIDDIKSSFGKQQVMSLIGAELSRIEPGIVAITLPYRSDLTQQDGYLHAGIITTIADSAY